MVWMSLQGFALAELNGNRRRKKAREQAALAAHAAQRQATFERAETFAAALARDLERCAAIHAVIARELADGCGLVR